MTRHATGTFEVKMQPQGEGDQGDGSLLARMSLDKRFDGDLQAAGTGQMLTARTGVPTSAAYVAIERVSGTLHGRHGSFALVHKGVMSTDLQRLAIDIVPDSGGGELAGISGTMAIRIEAGRHCYDLDYALPVQP